MADGIRIGSRVTYAGEPEEVGLIVDGTAGQKPLCVACGACNGQLCGVGAGELELEGIRAKLRSGMDQASSRPSDPPPGS